MSFKTLFQAIAEKHFAPGAPKPLRTKMPYRLSQDAAVDISITPLVLAEEAGSLCKIDLAGNHKIGMAGTFSLSGVDYHHAYLVGGDSAFIHVAVRQGQILETRLYRSYAEVIPATQEEWAGWLNEVPTPGVEFIPGYIGEPIMQSLNVDIDPQSVRDFSPGTQSPFDDTYEQYNNGTSNGVRISVNQGDVLPAAPSGFMWRTQRPYQYQRTWGAGNQHMAPIFAIETLVDASGGTTTVRHNMMHYKRALTDPTLSEYLLVSAVETDFGASVNFWLGVDISASDLTVFAAADTPV